MQRRTLVVAGTVLAAVAALYAASGFLLVPRLARNALLEHCRDEWHRGCAVDSVRFNPFLLAAEVRGLAIADADGSRMAGLDRLYIDLELASLWRRAFVFDAITLESPYAHAVQRADGTLNLLALASKPAPEKADGPLPRLAINDFTVTRGRVGIRDERRREAFQLALAPLDFRLQQFSTFAEGEHFRLIAGSDRAGRIDWQGSLRAEPLASAGTLRLTGMPASTVSDLLGERLPLAFVDGHLDVGLRYDFGLDGAPFRLVLSDGHIKVGELALRGHGQSVAWRVGGIELAGGTLDFAARKAGLASAVVRDVDTPLWFDRGGLALPGIQPVAGTPGGPRAVATASDAATPANAAGPAADWVFGLPELRIERLTAHIEDRRGATAIPFDLSVPSLAVRRIAWPLREAIEIEGGIASAAGGTVAFKGTTALAPLVAELDVDVDALDLAPLKPYVEAGRALDFRAATFDASGRLRYDASGGVRFAGDAALRDLHALDRMLNEDFLRWQAVEFKGIDYAGLERGLEIRDITAHRPFLRFVIGSDGITNVQEVLDPAGAAEARRAAREKREAGKPQRKRGVRRGEDTPAATTKPPPEPPLPFPARIDRVHIAAGTLDFADYTTLRPYFAAGIQDLRGTVAGLSSDPAARAKVQLTGKVDRYAPVTIDGEVNYLSAQSYTDLVANFRNIELTTFTPYSGKFAGYRIDKGKLTAELHYHVENRKLDAKHRIVADQLELGEKVDSPDATGLPVKLLIALLKDRHGVIDLAIPVTGTLDDPKFRLGPVIWKIVLNLLTKIVTSPFALLGSLFGDGPDLSTVDFAAGQAALDEASRQKLDTLKKALVERPGLSLEIPAVAIEARDAPALASARYDALLGEAAAKLVPPGGAAPAPDALRAEPKRWRQLLVRACTDRFGQSPVPPKPPAPEKDVDATPVDPLEYGNDWLEQQLREATKPDAAALVALARARAEAVRGVLLGDGQVDAARVFLTQGEGMVTESGGTRMTLKLQ